MSLLNNQALSRCVICLEGPKDYRHFLDDRSYFRCCGQPMCRACGLEFEKHAREGGCPCCRSTMGVLFILVDYESFDEVTLRRDGACETFELSDRAQRHMHRLMMRSAQAEKESIALFELDIRRCINSVVLSFLENEFHFSPILKELIQDRFMRPKDEQGSVRFVNMQKKFSASVYT